MAVSISMTKGPASDSRSMSLGSSNSRSSSDFLGDSMTRLIQIKNGPVRRVALVEEPGVRLLDSCSSIYELAHIAIETGEKLSDLARKRTRQDTIEYDPIYRGESEWRLLPA